MNYELKILPSHFEAVVSGKKTFEIRKNDWGFQAGDTVTLREYDPTYKGYFQTEAQQYTGRKFKARIGCVSSQEQQTNYVVFSLIPLR